MKMLADIQDLKMVSKYWTVEKSGSMNSVSSHWQFVR